MNKDKIRRKMMFSMIFMYFIAPQIWGIWMVFKLKIITFSEYLHLATSPVTIILLGVFFYVNRRYYIRTVEKFLANNLTDTQNKLRAVPSFHLLSIILFGTVGTFLVMLTLYFPKLGFVVSQPGVSFRIVITGMLAGASLTFIFFFLFTSIIINSFEAIVEHHQITKTYSLFYQYLPWNLILVIAGIFLMIFSTVESVALNSVTLKTLDFIKQLNFNILTLMVPIAMGTFLLVKQVRLAGQTAQKTSINN